MGKKVLVLALAVFVLLILPISVSAACDLNCSTAACVNGNTTVGIEICLTSDVTGPINIGANNQTLNCQDYNVNSTGTAITTNSKDYVTITDCNTNHGSYGVLVNGDYATVINNDMYNHSNTAVILEQSYANISYNTIDTVQAGIYAYGGSSYYNTIYGNNITNLVLGSLSNRKGLMDNADNNTWENNRIITCYEGAFASSSDNPLFKDNYIVNASNYGIHVNGTVTGAVVDGNIVLNNTRGIKINGTAHEAVVFNNTINRTYYYAIQVDSDRVNVSYNRLWNPTGYSAGGYSAIYLSNTENNTIHDNWIYGFGNTANIYAIKDNNGEGTQIYNNYVERCSRGIGICMYGGNTHWCNAYNNTVFNTTEGFCFNIEATDKTIVEYNNLSYCGGNDEGIFGGFAGVPTYDVHIRYNHISNSNYGIRYYSLEGSNIYSNTIIDNTYGIYFWSGQNSSFNTIYDNYFNNTNNAYDDGDLNYWNTTLNCSRTNILDDPCTGGNFWSDYTGNDTNGDGIGDTEVPHNSSGGITGSGGDYLPLVDIPPLVCGDTLTSNSAITGNYTCNGTAFIIGANDVTFNCNGYTIDGNGTGYGIYVNGYNNTNITDCVITDFEYGIYINDSIGTEVHGSTITDVANGTYIGESEQVSIFDMIISAFTNFGIYLYNAIDTVIDNFTISDGVKGIFGSNINDTNISDGSIQNMSDYALSFNNDINTSIQNLTFDSVNVDVLDMKDVLISELNLSEVGPDPSGFLNVSVYFNATNTSSSAYVLLNVYYNETYVSSLGLNEASLVLKEWNGTAWVDVPTQSVNTTGNYIQANITAFSGFGVFGPTAGVCFTPTNDTIYTVNGDSDLCTGTYGNVSFVMNATDMYFNCNSSIIDGLYYIGSGIDTNSKTNITIANCTVLHYNDGMVINSDNNTLVNNYVHNNSDEGMLVTGSYNTIYNNNFSYNGNTTTCSSSSGIFLAGTYNNITSNILTTNVRGIWVLGDNHKIYENQINSIICYAGIDIQTGSDDNEVYNNNVTGYISGNGYGTQLRGDRNYVHDNRYNQLVRGFYVDGNCFDSIIESNWINGSSNSGIVTDDFSDNITIQHNEIYETTVNGIILDGDTSNTTIYNNTIYDCGAQGIAAANTDNPIANITYNNITLCGNGIYIDGNHDNYTITYNTVTDADASCMYMTTGGASEIDNYYIAHNVLTTCDDDGISLRDIDDFTIYNNTLSDLGDDGSGNGIYVSRAGITLNENINITDNVINVTQGGDGILLEYIDSATIHDNVILDVATHAVSLYQATSNDVHITNNQMIDQSPYTMDTGARIQAAKNNTIMHNYIEGGATNGIYVGNSAENATIFNNTIYDVPNVGIYLSTDADDCNISFNNITKVDRSGGDNIGILLTNGCDNNIIHDNYIDGVATTSGSAMGIERGSSSLGGDIYNNYIINTDADESVSGQHARNIRLVNGGCDATIYNNTAIGKGEYSLAGGNEFGVIREGTQDSWCNITDNNFTWTSVGFWITNGLNVKVWDNYNYGPYVPCAFVSTASGSTGNEMWNNTCTGGNDAVLGSGIGLTDNYEVVTIHDNNVYNNTYGMRLGYVSLGFFPVNQTVAYNNTIYDNDYNLFINSGSHDNNLTDNKYYDSNDWDIYFVQVQQNFLVNETVGSGATEVVLDINNATEYIAIKEVPVVSRYTDPVNWNNLSAYFNATDHTSTGTLEVKVHYNESLATQESTIKLKRYNGTVWQDVPSQTLNTTENYVEAVITTFSQFGLFDTNVTDNDGDGYNSTIDCNDNNATIIPIYNNTDTYLNESKILCPGTYSESKVIMNASDIYLDCNGSTISSIYSNQGYAISITEQDNVTISNCIINKYIRGIHNSNSTNVLVYNNTVSGSGNYGIYGEYYADNYTIYNNRVNYTNTGILVGEGAANLNISHNSISTYGNSGILIYWISGATIEHNVISDVGRSGIRLWSLADGNVVNNNTLTDSGLYGFEINGADDNIFTNNIAYNNTKDIHIISSTNNTFTDQKIGTGSSEVDMDLTGNGISITEVPVGSRYPIGLMYDVGEFVNITQEAVGGFANFTMYYTDQTYETSYKLFKNNIGTIGGWIELPNQTLDIANNYITVNMTSFSQVAILGSGGCYTPNNDTYYDVFTNVTLCTGTYGNVSFNMSVDNIDFDCNSSTLDGQSVNVNPITITDYDGLDLQNCIITSYANDAVKLLRSDNAHIENNTIYGVSGYPINVEQSDNAYLTLNTLSSSSVDTIYSTYSDSITIYDNQVNGEIEVTDGLLATVTYNNISVPSGGTGIYLDYMNDSYVAYNDIYNGLYGIHINYCYNQTVYNNDVYDSTNSGIRLGVGDTGASSNNVDNATNAFLIEDGTSAVSNNQITNCNYGYYFNSADGNTITNQPDMNATIYDFASVGSGINYIRSGVQINSNGTNTNIYGDFYRVGFYSFDNPPADPANYSNITRYVSMNSTGIGSWADIRMYYSDLDYNSSVLDESTFRLWEWDGSWSQVPGSGVDTSNNYVYANVTSFSGYAILGTSWPAINATIFYPANGFILTHTTNIPLNFSFGSTATTCRLIISTENFTQVDTPISCNDTEYKFDAIGDKEYNVTIVGENPGVTETASAVFSIERDTLGGTMTLGLIFMLFLGLCFLFAYLSYVFSKEEHAILKLFFIFVAVYFGFTAVNQALLGLREYSKIPALDDIATTFHFLYIIVIIVMVVYFLIYLTKTLINHLGSNIKDGKKLDRSRGRRERSG